MTGLKCGFIRIYTKMQKLAPSGVGVTKHEGSGPEKIGFGETETTTGVRQLTA